MVVKRAFEFRAAVLAGERKLIVVIFVTMLFPPGVPARIRAEYSILILQNAAAVLTTAFAGFDLVSCAEHSHGTLRNAEGFRNLAEFISFYSQRNHLLLFLCHQYHLLLFK